MRISVVGLGKVGWPLVAVLAEAGHAVVAIDVDPAAVDRARSIAAPTYEPDLDALLAAGHARITATTDFALLADTDATFVIVPTPSTASGGYSLPFVLAAMASIGSILRAKDGFHAVALVSTVTPGAMDETVRPALEQASGKRCGDSIGLAYTPEFLALGSAIRDLRHPNLVVIGESDTHTGDRLEQVFRSMSGDAPIVRCNVINAELLKLALNTFLAMKISFANTIAGLCEHLPGADAQVVTQGLGLDRRIGARVLQGAVAYGGPCFPRDTQAFEHLAGMVGLTAHLARATGAVNRERLDQVFDLVSAHLPVGGRVAILGLAYKPETDVIDESPAIILASRLLEAGVEVVAYDPAAMPRAAGVLGDRVEFAPSAAACMSRGEVIVVATPSPEFGALTPACLQGASPRPIIVDCWRLLDPDSWREVATVVCLGVGPITAAGGRS